MQGMGARKRAVFLQLGKCFFVENGVMLSFICFLTLQKDTFARVLPKFFQKKSINFHFHGV